MRVGGGLVGEVEEGGESAAASNVAGLALRLEQAGEEALGLGRRERLASPELRQERRRRRGRLVVVVVAVAVVGSTGLAGGAEDGAEGVADDGGGGAFPAGLLELVEAGEALPEAVGAEAGDGLVGVALAGGGDRRPRRL